ncbi:hypothetical protein AWZ03_011270 [Drosophila navojoa]|uniref:ferroxidase n=1 Tax=Drosophila navojoa TaxID=7232 RepID=A0A484B0M6_DRONA|nr:frataxin homolog, mitochondrial [Drosophila navojoa]TDG42316.1 hypothetical protein AWZ03_011270 [Drosophila navojoa]
MERIRVFIRVAQAIQRTNRYSHIAALRHRNFTPISEDSDSSRGPEVVGGVLSRHCSNQLKPDYVVDDVVYERVCMETLESLSDYFDELTENAAELTGADVIFGDGVLSVNLGTKYGVYVINRQRPNKQIWLSSPTTGPKRFDYVIQPGQTNGYWVYKHTGVTLHQVLQNEITQIITSMPVNFMALPHCN